MISRNIYSENLTIDVYAQGHWKSSAMKQIKVLFLAAEAEPFVKIGGLGDVAGSLPRALYVLGDVDIRLVIPFHSAIQRQAYSLRPLVTFNISHNEGPIRAETFATDLNGLQVYLISGDPIQNDGTVYSSDAGVDGKKFTFFSLAVLELIRAINWLPDVLHANDWHTAPAIYALSLHNDPLYSKTATLVGIHNLPYLGEGAGSALQAFGLPPTEESTLPQWAQDLPLALGILSADHIVTVSPSYAREILTPDFGSGLENFLKTRTEKISGILNGIDTETWNPATDSTLVRNYSLENISARQVNKQALLDEFGLHPDPEIPLLGLVSRLEPQKGVDLIPNALRAIADQPWQAIFLGTGNPDLEDTVSQLETEFPSRIRVAIRYDEVLSHHIYASADALIIPSRYEPCGLTQMIAMRYGCVPIAHATGGLRDTIMDYEQSQKSTGFLFGDATSHDLSGTILRALRVFADQDDWLGLQLRGMSRDFSWRRSAVKYRKLYRTITSAREESKTR